MARWALASRGETPVVGDDAPPTGAATLGRSLRALRIAARPADHTAALVFYGPAALGAGALRKGDGHL
jgi:hypothetical protein